MVEPGVVSAYARALVERVLVRESGRAEDPEASRFAVSAREVIEHLRGGAAAADSPLADAKVAVAWAAIVARLDARTARVLELGELDLQILCAVAAPDLDPAIERVSAFA